MSAFEKSHLDTLVGKRVKFPGHFEGEVVVESARALGAGVEFRVRLASGHLDEAVLSGEDVAGLLEVQGGPTPVLRPVNADQLRLLVESARIRLAYAYDRNLPLACPVFAPYPTRSKQFI